MNAVLNIHEAQLAAEKLVEPLGIEIDWVEPHKGILSVCPGEESHGADDRRPVTVLLDWNPAPVFNCFHEDCKPLRNRLGAKLRARMLGKDLKYQPKYTQEQTQRWRSLKRIKAYARLDLKPDWLALPPFSEARWAELSPVRIPEAGVAQWKLFLRALFPRAAIVWCGQKYETGLTAAEKAHSVQVEGYWIFRAKPWQPEPQNSDRFRTVAEWLGVPDKYCDACGPFVSPASFGQRLNRKKGNVKGRHYLVLENDHLPPEEFGKIQWELNDNFRLAAVVASGKKSWHAWYPLPEDQRQREYLWALCEGLSADMQTAKHNLAVRAPGWIRRETGRMQKLLYLNPVYPL